MAASNTDQLMEKIRRLAGRHYAYAILICTGLLMFLPNLGQHGLWDVDEAHNAECAREMLEAGNLVVPTFNYQLRTDKPAMLYWWIQASYSLFGVNEWSARLPSVLAGIGSLLTCYEIGRRLFSKVTGLLAALILSSSFMFSVSSHAVTPDAILIFLVQLTFLTWIIAYDRRQPIWLIFTGCCAGLAMLTKGPVGIALPGTVIVLFLLWQRDIKFLFQIRTLQAIGWCLLLAIPWYAYVGYETRGAFLKGFFLTHNISRFNAPMEGHQGPFFYHLIVILIAFAPWSIFLGPTLWRSIQTGVKPIVDSKSWAYRLLICWVGVWFIVFSIAATKLPNYVLPTYPPLALLTAAWLVHWWKKSLSTQPDGGSFAIIPTWAWRTCLVCFITIGVLLLVALPVVSGWIPLTALEGRTLPDLVWLLPVGFIPLITGWLTWKKWSQQQIGWGIGTIVAGSLLLTASLSAFGPMIADQERGSKRLAEALFHEIGTNDYRVGFHHHYNRPSMVFYLKREVIRCKNHDQVLETLQAKVPVYMFVPARDWPHLEEQLPGKLTIHTQRHDFTAGQDILLISNQNMIKQINAESTGQ